jgi:hypothetical protein
MTARPARTRPGASPLGRPTLTASVEPLAVGDGSRTGDSQTPVVRDSRTPVAPESGTGAGDAVLDEIDDSAPLWQTLARKEARLHYDQVEELGRLRRRLSRARVSKIETITDNTLLRIATALLLDRQDALHGDTEAELLASLGLPPRRRP